MKHTKKLAKKPQRLTSITAKMLGVNSNTAGYFASKKAIYYNTPKIKDTLTEKQKYQLEILKKNLPKSRE